MATGVTAPSGGAGVGVGLGTNGVGIEAHRDRPVILQEPDLMYEFTCTVCDIDRLNVEAVCYCKQCLKQFCEDCDKYHRKLHRAHTVLNQDQVQGWGIVKAVDILEMCEIHTDKKMDIYCADHDMVCCSACALQDHRSCVAVNPLIKDIRHADIHHRPRPLDSLPVPQVDHAMMTPPTLRKPDRQALLDSRRRFQTAIEEQRAKFIEMFEEIKERTNMEFDVVLGKGRLSGGRLSAARLSGRQRRRSMDPSADGVRKVTHCQTYNVKAKGDKSTCNITGCCQLPNFTLVIADLSNMKVKLLDEDYAVIDQCVLQYQPRAVCYLNGHIDDDEVAVTLPGINVVQFIRARRGQMKLTRKFELEHACGDIQHVDDTLYVSSYTAIYTYTMAGELLQKVYEDLNGDNTVWRFTVTDNCSKIYLTNWSHHIVTTIDDNGKTLTTFQAKDLQKLTGVCLDDLGSVFVCGAGSNNIIQVDASGKNKLSTVAREAVGLKCPEIVSYNKYTAELIVGQNCDNNILVFTM